MIPSQIHTFADLVSFLESYASWNEGHEFDVGGVFVLMKALLGNLKSNALDAELQNINAYLDSDEKDFLAKLSEYSRLPEDD